MLNNINSHSKIISKEKKMYNCPVLPRIQSVMAVVSCLSHSVQIAHFWGRPNHTDPFARESVLTISPPPNPMGLSKNKIPT